MAEDLRSHYDVLGVPADVGADELRRAWLAMARRHHPDRGGDPARMREVNEAWAVLGNPSTRRRYDVSLGGAQGTSTAGGRDEAGEHASYFVFVDADEDDTDDAAGAFVARTTRPQAPGLALVPPALFAISIAIGCTALVLDEPALLGFAVLVFFLSCVAVAAVALLSLRSPRGSNRRRD